MRTAGLGASAQHVTAGQFILLPLANLSMQFVLSRLPQLQEGDSLLRMHDGSGAYAPTVPGNGRMGRWDSQIWKPADGVLLM